MVCKLFLQCQSSEALKFYDDSTLHGSDEVSELLLGDALSCLKSLEFEL